MSREKGTLYQYFKNGEFLAHVDFTYVRLLNAPFFFFQFQGKASAAECSGGNSAWTVRTRCQQSRNNRRRRDQLLDSISKTARARPTTWRGSRKYHRRLPNPTFRITATQLPFPSPSNLCRCVEPCQVLPPLR